MPSRGKNFGQELPASGRIGTRTIVFAMFQAVAQSMRMKEACEEVSII